MIKNELVDAADQTPNWVPQVNYKPLYIHPMPSQWVGLSEEELDKINKTENSRLDLARAIEQALKEKNNA